MNPPVSVEGVYLKNNNNKFTIFFKEEVTKSEKELNEMYNKEELISWILKHGKEIKFAQKINDHKLEISNIKVMNILGGSKLGSKSNKFTIYSLILNYNYSFVDGQSSNYIGTLTLTENKKPHPPFKNVKIICTYSKKVFTLSISYTDDDNTTNNMKKVQLAHSIRNMIIPFKKAIC